MKIAVCDDQPDILKQIKKMLSKMRIVRKTDCFSDMEEFWAEADKVCYDAVLMDIEWKQEENGLDFGRKLYEKSPCTKVIYMTAYGMAYVEDIFLNGSNLSGFLTKPVDREQLERNLRKVWNGKQENEGKLLIHRQGSTLAVPLRDIWYLESRLHKTSVVLKDQTYACGERLDAMGEKLDDRFVVCHKSYIVNMQYIRELQGKELLLADPFADDEEEARRVPISRARLEETREKYFSYIAGLL